MIRASTTIKTYTTRAARSLTSLSKVWSRVDLIKPSFLTRSINSSYHNYSIPPGGYWPEYHHDRSPSFENCWSYVPGSTFGYNSREMNFLAGKSYGEQNSFWAYGNEFGGRGNWNGDQYVGPHWRHYGQVCSNGSGRFEGYPNWENMYCPHSREVYYWGYPNWENMYCPHSREVYYYWGTDVRHSPIWGGWRSFGPEYRCRFCGCQQFLPVNYCGNWNWNPNAGMCWGGVVQGNGYVDQGINYNRGDWSHTFQNNTAGGSGNFYGNDGRNLGPYGVNSADFPRNQNENEGRDSNANQNQNVGQHRQNLGDSYNERQEVPRVNGFEEQHIVHDGYRRPQDAYRWNNHNFTENDGRDGHDQVAWTQSRSSYNHYGPEHSFHNESKRFNQGTGYVDRKNVNTDNQTRLENNGGPIVGQFQNSTVNGRLLNSNGAGGGEEYKRTGQSSRVPDVLRKDNNHGSNEHNWSFTSQSGSDYSRDQVMGSNGHENLNGRVHSRPEVENNNNVNLGHKDNIDGDRWRHAKDQPEKFTVREQLANMIDKRGNLHQSPETCHRAINETATDSQRHLGVRNIEMKEKQQPWDNSNRYTQKMDRNRHPAQNQNSDRSEAHPNVPSATLSEEHPNEVPQGLNCERPVENLSREQIRGTAEELESFTKDGKLKLAVEVLDVMEKKNERLDPERDMSKVKMLIQACGDSKAVTEAKAVHKHIVNLMSPLKFSLYNKILDMYLKCGAVADACSMFYNMSAHNLTSWDTMIKGLVRNNLAEEALDVFAEFKNTESEPDGPMFLGVFSACRHVGDVTEGMLHFESMTKHYGITPSMKHYISIVDMMGHVGHLEEAMEFIEKMPVEPSVDVWETMMNVCSIHGNTELRDRCAEVVQELYPTRFPEELKAGLVPLTGSDLETDKVGNGNRPGHENSKAFQQILNISHGNFLNGNPIGGQYEKRFDVASNGEASRIFQDNKGAKEDGVIAWDDDESWNGSDLGNLYDPLPDFTANEPLNSSKTNAQMPNINDTRNSGGRPSHTIVHDSIDASRRCRRIIDLLESEDK
ncbi:unnamed protein product [Rhodiola kirilowii]